MDNYKIKMSFEEYLRNHGLAQDITTKYIVRNHIYLCQSSLIEHFLSEGQFFYEDVINYYVHDSETDEHEPQEIFEWWACSDWLTEKLKEEGEPILDNDFGEWYGRCATGQALCLDYNLQKLAYDMDVNELYIDSAVA